MSKEAFKFSGEGAANYEHYLGPLLFEPSAEILKQFIETKNVSSILEIAAGTGRVTKHLRLLFPSPLKLIASDISPDMLEISKKTLNDTSIEYTVADAQQLPFPDNSFDLIIFQYGIMFLPDRQKGIDEAYRVLKPGGNLIFSTWDKTENMPLMKIVFNDVLLNFFDKSESEKYLMPFSMHEAEIHRNLLEKSKFKKIEVRKVEFAGQSPSAEDIVNGFLLKHSLGKEVAEKDPNAVNVLADKMRAMITEKFGTKKITTPLFAFLAKGLK